MLKIGVTGGTGFIGQYLLREYADVCTFVVITSGNSKKKLFEAPTVHYVVGDYTEQSLCSTFAGCDGIVNLGAKRSSPESENAFSNYLGNLSFSESVFRAARELGIGNIVNLSSTAVYDKDLPVPFSEAMAVSPLSFYGASKRSIELCAALYNKRYGMHIKSLRLAQVVGEGERPGYILSVFKDRCREGLPLEIYGQGKSGKEYIYVKDVVRAIMLALEHSDKHGVYNIGSGVFTTNLELAQTFCRVFNNEAGYVFLSDKRENVYEYYMDTSLAKRELGFECKYDLNSAIADTKREMELRNNG